MRGKIIVFEGVDGSGKNTQSEMLGEYLEKIGKRVKKVSFPDYESESSSLVRMYLKGRFGENPDSVNPYACSSFYAVDRYAVFKSGLENFYGEGGIVVADRYTTSNAVHQCAKLPERERDSFLEWLFEYEYSLLGIPEPDAVIYLRVPYEVGAELVMKRYSGDDKKRDIHEKNLDYLRRSCESADYCAEKYGWRTVECMGESCMKSPEEIALEVRNIVQNIQI